MTRAGPDRASEEVLGLDRLETVLRRGRGRRSTVSVRPNTGRSAPSRNLAVGRREQDPRFAKD